MVPLYIHINSFSTKLYAPTHGLSSILPGVSTPLLIQKKNQQTHCTRYFYKVLTYKVSQRLWGY